MPPGLQTAQAASPLYASFGSDTMKGIERMRRGIILLVLFAATVARATADQGWRPPPGWTAQKTPPGAMILFWAGVRKNSFTPNINVLWDNGHAVDVEWAYSLKQFQALQIVATSHHVE